MLCQNFRYEELMNETLKTDLIMMIINLIKLFMLFYNDHIFFYLQISLLCYGLVEKKKLDFKMMILIINS